MTRLIDADVLERAIYEWMPKDQEAWMDSWIPPIENLVVSFMMTIQEQPTVDAVPVIRCGECGHFKKLHIDRGLCLQTEGCVRIHDFCSWAERKEEE